jgi:RecB family exonuclease
MCTENRLELRGGPLSPIQILSPEMAAGGRFDAAWIANVHDGNWPSHPLTNPLLPTSAAERIPRSTAAGELEYCERLTRELKSLAAEVRFSWSRQTGDVPNGISPLLADLAAAGELAWGPGEAPTSSMHSLVATEARRLNGYHNHPWLIAVADGQGFPLRGCEGFPLRGGEGLPLREAQELPLRDAPGEGLAEGIPGGSGMISDQAACPMLAYFRHRLKAGFEAMPQPFADAAYRGTLMHAAMQFLFAGHEGQPGVPPSGRVAAAVAAALNKHHARQRLLPVSFEAERLRLENLLQQWLEFETVRQGFTVEGLEQTITAELRGHPISIRADRIDRLDDSGLMIIDYKSSKARTSGWSQDRLQQAQLPLYAVLLSRQIRHLAGGADGGVVGGAVSGVALATVRQGECGFSGIGQSVSVTFDGIRSFADRKTGFAKRFSDWQQIFRHWEIGIDALAGEIEQGLSANVVFDKTALQWSGMDILLRREEGAAWLLEHGGVGDEGNEGEEGDEGENISGGSGYD